MLNVVLKKYKQKKEPQTVLEYLGSYSNKSMTNIPQKTDSAIHIINYSAQKMAQKFDNQYFNTERHKLLNTNNLPTTPLDNYTVFVRPNLQHSQNLPEIYKTLLHKMRNVAKTNYTLKETKEQRRPRIQYCGYTPNGNDNKPVQLCKNEHGNLFFNGLANCGGYWRCPVCALKISENKKELLTGLISAHQSKGLSIGFLTLTVRHSKHDVLKKTLNKLLNNYRSFQNQKFFSRGKKNFGYIGQVKTLEITFSKNNGWHPHLHVLFFYDNSNAATASEFQKDFISRWFKYKDNNGLLKSQNQQILTRDISDYIAKYDITSEMTKGNIKGSKGLTPFTALGKIALGDYEDIHEKRLLYAVYSNYVEETQGRHFVHISNALRDLYKDFLTENDKTDEEIVNQTSIDEVVLKITIPIWKKIAINDLQPLVLNKFKENGLSGVYDLLIHFKDFNGLEIDLDKDDIPILTFWACPWLPELPIIKPILII